MNVRIEVDYADQQTGHYAIPEGEGWRVDASLRVLVIGRGVPRTMVPLDNVQAIRLVESTPSIEETLARTGVKANTWQSAARRLADENARLRAAGFTVACAAENPADSCTVSCASQRMGGIPCATLTPDPSPTATTERAGK